VIGVDHVVINTPDLMRTSDALTAATGAPLKRVRDAGNNMQQGFHRLGSVVVEIVTCAIDASGAGVIVGLCIKRQRYLRRCKPCRPRRAEYSETCCAGREVDCNI